MEHISSRQNAVVRRLRELAANRGERGEALLDGEHLVSEALSSGVELTLVAVSSDAAAGRLEPLVARAAQSATRIVTMPPALLSAVSPVRNPSGIVALARLAPITLDEAFAGPPQLVLLLDTIQDPGNVGAIIRAAEGCGATGIVVTAGTADPYGWKALRGAMGSTFRMPVAAADSLADAIAAARRAGLHVFATVPRGGTALATADLARPSAVVLGGEGPGLSADAIASSDERLTIPMKPPVESLNVAIAAALVLYEASRQRRHVAV